MNIKSEFLDFKKARTFVRKLNLQSAKEWKAYCQTGQRPANIPSNPNAYYKHTGWSGYLDWLRDTRFLVNGKYRSFKKARVFARSLKLSTVTEWRTFAASSNRPKDIPVEPHIISLVYPPP